MTLSDWITSMSANKVSALLEVELNTIYYWRDLKTLPKPEMMRKIVKVTHGLVGYADIIEPYFDDKEARA